MRLKVPKTLVTFPNGREVLIYNYLTKKVMSCASENIYWLLGANEWTDIEDICQQHPDYDPQTIRTAIQELVEGGALLIEGSEAAHIDATFATSWELGPAAAMLHFSLLDNEYQTYEEGVAKQAARKLNDPSPQLFWKNEGVAVPLPRIKLGDQAGSLASMARRRTRRNVTSEPVALVNLSECLFAGLGITGFVQTPTAALPLKMAPGGGARNAYEAYVWVRNVDGLEQGIYHYSAVEHSLQKLADSPNLPPQDLVQKQPWADAMPVIIFLVAVLERVSWKYQDPNAYRVVMIEAGHIGQNMMLSATDNKLTLCPTAALNHREISQMLGLTKLTHTPVYALTLGHPGENLDQIYCVSEGEKLAAA